MKCFGYIDWYIKNCKVIRIDFYFYVDFMLRELVINFLFRNCFFVLGDCFCFGICSLGLLVKSM